MKLTGTDFLLRMVYIALHQRELDMQYLGSDKFLGTLLLSIITLPFMYVIYVFIMLVFQASFRAHAQSHGPDRGVDL